MPPSENSLIQETSIKQYKETQLKRGGQGTVYKYTYPPTGRPYAVKVIEYDYELDQEGNPKNMVYMIRECHMSRNFQHAHLLRAHEVFEYEEGFAIIMPFFPRGSLLGLKIRQDEMKNVMRQILEALRHLHERGRFHRDIKPDNILVRNRPGEPFDLVVADYGLISTEKPISFVGSPKYTAPEIARNKELDKAECRQYDDKVDIYALGMLLLDLLDVYMPSCLIRTRKKFNKYIGARLDDALDECDPENVERHDALLTAQRMIQFNPRCRPSADECLRIPWLSGPPATPLPGQLARVPSNLSAVIPLADLSVAEPVQTWWHSTAKAAAPAMQLYKHSTSGRYPKRKRKHPERYSPVSSPRKFKVSKTLHKSLPTPRPTPENVERLWKSEDAQPLEPIKPTKPTTARNALSFSPENDVQESNDLLSWDNSKMES